jgi:hypothetical protein
MAFRLEGARPHLLDLRVLMPGDFAEASTPVRVGESEVRPVTAAHVLDRAAIAHPVPKHRDGERLDVTSGVSPVEAVLHHKIVRVRLPGSWPFGSLGAFRIRPTRVPSASTDRSLTCGFGFRAGARFGTEADYRCWRTSCPRVGTPRVQPSGYAPVQQPIATIRADPDTVSESPTVRSPLG